MLSKLSATKVAVFFLTFFMIVHFTADASRTECDEEYKTIIVYDCTGAKCSETKGYTTITVSNAH